MLLQMGWDYTGTDGKAEIREVHEDINAKKAIESRVESLALLHPNWISLAKLTHLSGPTSTK